MCVAGWRWRKMRRLQGGGIRMVAASRGLPAEVVWYSSGVLMDGSVVCLWSMRHVASVTHTHTLSVSAWLSVVKVGVGRGWGWGLAGVKGGTSLSSCCYSGGLRVLAVLGPSLFPQSTPCAHTHSPLPPALHLTPTLHTAPQSIARRRSPGWTPLHKHLPRM